MINKSYFRNIIITVFILYLTFPITVSAVERSFSKFKIIKNYLQSTMAEESLSGVSIISIENKRARKLNLEKIMDKLLK